MKNKRTTFYIICILLFTVFTTPATGYGKDKEVKITILFTNDTHSRIESYPANDSKNPGLGGYARRAALIKKIRSEEPNVMLFDAGDVFQGTPYFNFFGGELEFKLMSMMGYTAMTLGNHDFDNGLEGLLKQLPQATFDIISSNYDFSATILKDKIQACKIYNVAGVKVGVFGLGIELQGLVSALNYGKTRYLNPVEKAAEMAYLLKKEKKCDLVICLSHLGFSYQDKKVSDATLAKQSKNIDIIIGGHTHTFMDKPYTFRNSDGKNIIIGQVGTGGVKLGRIDLLFSKKNGIKVEHLSAL
ncbi:MAG TPA: metallophosphatase [Bacteroidales bacterium]|nr:metallophosphatase [Bacteroidales bacterium]HNZ42563.1 metallophosphatase [Bacteroidales bacterium]HOH83285.1 metallophosphatase [Bacteroidales bacterium]HPB25587.1 metallophosphatase [Bacteroidales bacterium]HPI29871.1 metallophosphatase [Bacteroidales bacterium]